jgi:IS5 family transposase
MRPKEKVKTHAQGLLEDRRLDPMLRMEHELVRLAGAIDWDGLAESFGALYSEKTGRLGIPIRTMAGLVMLQHTFGLSDEQVVREWPERPYWQFFCGEEFFSVFPVGIRETKRHIQHELPVDFSQISRWRKRIGKEGVERILKLTIEAGLRTQTITPKQMQVVVVDTTVQPKAVEHPRDARLYRKTLRHLLKVAEETGTKLRQSHRNLAKSASLMHGRYAKAKQFRRAARERKKLKVYAGRVLRDLERKLSGEDYERHKGTMILAELALTQEKKTKGKVYSMHAPEVECIAKGKAHKPYELGVSPEQERRTTLPQRWPAGWRT